jgi:hypothetical protein
LTKLKIFVIIIVDKERTDNFMNLIFTIIFVAMWLSAGISMMYNMSSVIDDKISNFNIFILIATVLVTAPFLLVTQGAQIIFDLILPEGWDEDDETKH